MSNVHQLFPPLSPSNLQFVEVEIYKGVWTGDPTPRWFVAGAINDGSEIVLDMKLSHAEAIESARESATEFDVPLVDHTL